jgi:hypothetical protein
MAYNDRIQTLINLGIIQEEKDLSHQARKVLHELADAEFDVILLARQGLQPQDRAVYDNVVTVVAF